MDAPEKPPEVQIPTGAPAPSRASERSPVFPPEASTEVPPPNLPPIAQPQVPSAPVPTNSGGSRATLWVFGILVGIVALIAMFGLASSSGSSTSSTYSGGSYTPATAPANVPPQVSKALDENNGFKDFHFGMTVSEAKAVLEPTRMFRNEGANSETLFYLETPVNRIGEFAMDSVGLRFFEGKLFRIDIRFSNFQNEIFEALKIIYGEPSNNSSWTRNTQILKAKCWVGGKIYAAIVGPTNGAWDAIVIYDQAANQKAREYADAEPARAAKDFSTNGFKTLMMGMKLDAIPNYLYVVSEDNEATGIKKVTINRGDLLTIGYYPLGSVDCEFFKERLYRIDLHFEDNRKEIFKSVQERFGVLQPNDSWTRGGKKLTGKSAGDKNFFALVVAPGGTNGEEEWDYVILMDDSIVEEAKQYKQGRAKEAVKDFSSNGFKSLTMGMSLKALTADYTVTENSEVTGIKEISVSQGDLLRLGSFRLQSVRCAFFNDQLYHIGLGFNEEQQEVLKTFESRFGPLQKNDGWTQGELKLTAKSGGSAQFFATILAPGGAHNGENWDYIILLNLDIQRAAEQFKLDAPKRAAKDLLASSKGSEEKSKEAEGTLAKPHVPVSPIPAGQLPDFITQGSHKDDIIRLQGTPDSIQRYEALGYEQWYYGSANVDISIRDGRLIKWSNSGNRLKVSMTPGNKATEATSFTQGSHKDDIIRLQGTPDSIQRYEALGYEQWYYGSANVDISIRDGRLIKWSNSGNRLKVSSR